MVTRDFTQRGSPKSCFWPILTRKMKFGVRKYFFSKENPIFSPNLICGHHTMCTLAKNSKKHILTIFLCNFPLEWLQGTLHREDLQKAVFGQFWPEKWNLGWKNIFSRIKIQFFPQISFMVTILWRETRKNTFWQFSCVISLWSG